jgi:hypothetical protein
MASGKAATNAQGFLNLAAGQQDSVYEGIVRTWYSQGYKNLYIRLGYDMNDSGNTWYQGDTSAQAAALVKAFQHVASVMRAVPGGKVHIIWNPKAINYTEVPVSSVYPGDQYVDIMGLDIESACWPLSLVDQTTGKVAPNISTWCQNTANREYFWNGANGLSTTWGMQQHLNFAQAHKKPIAICQARVGVNPVYPHNGLADDGDFPVWLAKRLKDAAKLGIVTEFVNIEDAGSYSFSDGSKPLAAAAWSANFGKNSPAIAPSTLLGSYSFPSLTEPASQTAAATASSSSGSKN